MAKGKWSTSRWLGMSKGELNDRLAEETRRLNSIDPKERRIAKTLIIEIELELTRRFEKSFGLE